MNGQPGLQAGNRRRRAAVSVVNGGGHRINRPEPGDRLRIIDVSRQANHHSMVMKNSLIVCFYATIRYCVSIV